MSLESAGLLDRCAPMKKTTRLLILLVAFAAYVAIGESGWHADPAIRRAAAIVIATLILWISEVAPLGVIALMIPVAATASGILTWKQAIASWGDETVFLFLGAFLLARALDKFGGFEWVARLPARSGGGRTIVPALAILMLAGAISTVQNNTAVAALLLPATIAIARNCPMPSVPLLALSYGATFGGMSTPVGTAPNFIGYGAMRALDPQVNFVSWLAVGIPVWLGTSVIGISVLAIAVLLRSSGLRNSGSEQRPVSNGGQGDIVDPKYALADIGPARPEHEGSALPFSEEQTRLGRFAAWAVFSLAAITWLTIGFVKSATGDQSAPAKWLDRFLPDSIVPIIGALMLFVWPLGRSGRSVLDRHDFQALDWDTLFLIAGGLCLGKTLDASGAAKALAATVGELQLSPTLVMLAIGGVTVLLSELTSNTATAQLMVPIASALAPAVGLQPVTTIWLVALSASLGFALPVSTPPNAIVYGTRLVPLRTMVVCGLVVDVLGLVWVVACVRWFG